MGDLIAKAAVNLPARARTARARRVATRGHLLAIACQLLARRSPDALTVDDVVSAAKVARGTFYNYFTTVAELAQASFDHALASLGAGVARDLASLPPALAADRPARLALLLRSFLEGATREPGLGWVVVRVSPSALPSGTLPLQRLLREGRAHGDFHFSSEPVAVQLLAAGLVSAMRSVLASGRERGQLDAATLMLLQAMGVAPGRAAAALRTLRDFVPRP